jgi:hypothetical protein
MTTETKPPVAKIRDGNLEISIWENETEKGTRYAADGVIRSYKVGEEYKNTRSLSNGELLRAARLHELAYTKILELRAAKSQA